MNIWWVVVIWDILFFKKGNEKGAIGLYFSQSPPLTKWSLIQTIERPLNISVG
jgi:hypothetical protein